MFSILCARYNPIANRRTRSINKGVCSTEKAIDRMTVSNKYAESIKKCLVKWLLTGGLGFRASEDVIGNEVLFASNWRRADLLILSREFHALEIKGPADSVALLADQLADYHRVFDKVSVVTVKLHISSIRRIASRKTGIICCDGDEPLVIREATRTARLDKGELCRFLGKSELTSVLGIAATNLSTDELRGKLVSQATAKSIRQLAYNSVRHRYLPLFRSFLRDIGDSDFGEDDLRGLCGTADAIRT